MSDAMFQSVRLRRGAHASPRQGACVVELASMLAGERFSDHPRTVCPVIAGFLRMYNDRLPEATLGELRPLAPMVIGSASTWFVRRRRKARLAAWMQAEDPRRRVGRFATRNEVVVAAGRTAAALDPGCRTAVVADIVAELVTLGGAAAPVESALPAVHLPAEPETAAAPQAETAAARLTTSE